MVTWNFFRARRLKNGTKVERFLRQNECYTYEKLAVVLKQKGIICPPEGEFTDELPKPPAPQRRKPQARNSKLGLKEKAKVSEPAAEATAAPVKAPAKKKPAPKKKATTTYKDARNKATKSS